MNALKRLEKGGIRFELTAEGEIAYHNSWPGDVPREWVDPLLAEVRARRDEVAAILSYRRAWIEVFDQWSALLAEQSDDPQRDIDFLRQLESLAIAGLMPCYDGGEADLGADGWRRVMDRQIRQLTHDMGQVNPDSDKE